MNEHAGCRELSRGWSGALLMTLIGDASGRTASMKRRVLYGFLGGIARLSTCNVLMSGQAWQVDTYPPRQEY